MPTLSFTFDRLLGWKKSITSRYGAKTRQVSYLQKKGGNHIQILATGANACETLQGACNQNVWQPYQVAAAPYPQRT